MVKKYVIIALGALLLAPQTSDCMNDTEIRLYQENDRAFFNDILASNANLLLPGYSLEEEIQKTIEFIESDIVTAKVAIKNGKPIGLIAYQCANLAVVQLLVVAEQYRRQGIGNALLSDAKASISNFGCASIYLNTKVTNIAARTFYESRGFKLAWPISSKDKYCIYECEV